MADLCVECKKRVTITVNMELLAMYVDYGVTVNAEQGIQITNTGKHENVSEIFDIIYGIVIQWIFLDVS